MKKPVFLSAILWMSIHIANAQSYNIFSIPDSLTKDANAVKRYEELRITIKDIDKAVIHHKYAMTILNEAGKRYSVYYNDYNKMKSLSDIDGNLYDASGKHLKNVKKKDIADFINDDQMTLVTDNRIKVHNFSYGDYPYTVEYEDEQEYDGIFFLPNWTPQRSNRCAVEQSRFIVETPVDYKLRYKAFRYSSEPVIVNDGKKITYTWQVKNLHAFDDEDLSPRWDEITTSVYVAPVDFEIEGYKGKMDTWQNLGKFVALLNAGRDVLPDNVKKDIHNLTDNLKTPQQKTFAVYNYLQQNTRYILVKLGIGGWQPLDANYVATKKYGDCKALSNYMKSLLKEVGVKGYYVLVNADDEDLHGLWEDFPSPYFNHAVLCVPENKDTLWFECTSQTAPPGFMGSSVGNRKALMITDDGGYIVNTPVYKTENNMQVRTVKASIDSTGTLEASLFTNYTGIKEEIPHALINDVDKDFRDKFLNKELNLPTYKIDDTKYTEKKDLIPEVNEQLQITAPSYATFSGKRIFIKPNLFNKIDSKYNEDDMRLFDIECPYSFHDIDSIKIAVPQGYTAEAAPKNIDLSSKFGSYKIEFKVLDDNIEVIRDYQTSSGRFPASDFKDFAKFNNDMYKADRGQIVLIKKEN
jgi:transglutaminase-like putative cysteine protease